MEFVKLVFAVSSIFMSLHMSWTMFSDSIALSLMDFFFRGG
jgi:hypothetical protein